MVPARAARKPPPLVNPSASLQGCLRLAEECRLLAAEARMCAACATCDGSEHDGVAAGPEPGASAQAAEDGGDEAAQAAEAAAAAGCDEAEGAGGGEAAEGREGAQPLAEMEGVEPDAGSGGCSGSDASGDEARRHVRPASAGAAAGGPGAEAAAPVPEAGGAEGEGAAPGAAALTAGDAERLEAYERELYGHVDARVDGATAAALLRRAGLVAGTEGRLGAIGSRAAGLLGAAAVPRAWRLVLDSLKGARSARRRRPITLPHPSLPTAGARTRAPSRRPRRRAAACRGVCGPTRRATRDSSGSSGRAWAWRQRCQSRSRSPVSPCA